MEKFIFLASLKNKLTELDIPRETVDKHIKIFEDCFVGKTASEIDKVIDGAGGLEGIVKSVYNLEKAKTDNKQKDASAKKDTLSDAAKKAEDRKTAEEPTPEEMTREINTHSIDDNIDKHIREAEEITSELEKTTVNAVITENALETEFSDDISEYDFEILFAEKLSKPEKWVKSLKEKISEKTYKSTLPLAILADALIFLISILLFPILIVSAIFVALIYIGVLVLGVCFSLVPIGYGVYMSFKTMPIALYEMGLGILVLGITMLASILLYNYLKRLVPFLFKQLKKLFALCIRITKRYFGKTVKEKA